MHKQTQPEDKSVIFACYPRVSTDEQAETNLSLPTQIDRCVEFLSRYAEAVLWEDYILREDASGMTFDRPQLTKLREWIRQRKIDAIIVNSSDRLSRRPGHAEELFDEMLKYGVRLFIVMHGRELRLDNPSDRQLLLMEMGFNRQWWHMIREAMMRGQRGAAERGGVAHGGNYVYGYRRVKNDETRLFEMVVYDPEAVVVQSIYSWFVYERIGTSEIQRRLKGTLTPIESGGQVKSAKLDRVRKRKPGEWSLSAVYRILHNPTYIGKFTQYKTSEAFSPLSMDVPAIIDPETWDAAQRILDEGKKKSRRNAESFAE